MPVDSTQRAAERWFLRHGLPAVLTPRARLRALWARSAPGFAGYATVVVVAVVIYLLTGAAEVNIDGEPTTVEWVVLALVIGVLPAAVLAGWLVSGLKTTRSRRVASTIAVAVATIPHLIGGDVLDVGSAALAVVVTLLLTASGLGSVLGWALRMAWSQLRAAGELLIGALPVVLLTVLVFFNTYVWLMAAAVTRTRLWLAIAFLVLIASAFIVSGLLDRARPVLDSATASPCHAERLQGTPFADMQDPTRADPLTRTERLNVVFVLAVSQIAQIVMVSVVTAGIFFILGLILLNPKLLELWTHEQRSDGTLLGMTIPVPESLIQMTLFLAAVTFMYIGARAVGGGEYRAHFLDPLIDDLELTVLARNRYRGRTPSG